MDEHRRDLERRALAGDREAALELAELWDSSGELEDIVAKHAFLSDELGRVELESRVPGTHVEVTLRIDAPNDAQDATEGRLVTMECTFREDGPEYHLTFSLKDYLGAKWTETGSVVRNRSMELARFYRQVVYREVQEAIDSSERFRDRLARLRGRWMAAKGLQGIVDARRSLELAEKEAAERVVRLIRDGGP